MSAFAQRLRQGTIRSLVTYLGGLELGEARTSVFAFLTIASVGAAKGGYYATSWGWTSMIVAWVAALAVLGRSLIRISRLESAVLGAILAFGAWTALSIVWSESATQTALQFERTLVYVAAVIAAIVITQSTSYRALLAGVWAGITALCGYALLTHLFSGAFPSPPTIAGNRLEDPIGYWNSLGLLAAIGCVLALGFASYAGSLVLRAAAAASLVLSSVTLYFTFSRGSWLALGVGVVVLFVVDPHRVRLATGFLAASSFAVLGVLFASRESSLTRAGSLGPDAVAEGRHLTEVLLVLALAGAAATTPIGRLAPLLERRGLERGFSVLLGALALLALLGVFVQFGSPTHIARRGWHAFEAPPVNVTTSLNNRLFSASGSWRSELWRVAILDIRHHPILGSGAGTFEEEWLAHRHIDTQVVNAHNLYLETFAELGPVGLGLLLVVLFAPLLAAIRARGRPLVPVAAAAYVAFLVHAAVDWDWQIPAVTLAALFAGVAILAAARPDMSGVVVGRRGRRGLVVVTIAVALVGGLGLLGNRAAAGAANDANRREWAQAEAEAHGAIDWMPWSSIGWEQLGDAQYEQGKIALARSSYAKAISKDRNNWQLWLELALASTGAARHEAAQTALALDPRSSEIASEAQALDLNLKSSVGK
jgi:O-antigen ligase